MSGEHEKGHLVQALTAAMHRASGGHRYRLHLEELDVDNLRELLRFVRDVDNERCYAVTRARINPWRR
jgi:hypothetical protein